MTPQEFVADPLWADFIPEMSVPVRVRHLPTHEDCSRISVEDAQAHLCQGGTLGAMKGYEERPGQIAMCGAIANAFNGRGNLMVEAGTGVGKSLAYLVPSILWAWTNDTPVVVSTATRNLQSQLMDFDIPRAVKILGNCAADFKVALLKGRTNYLCLKAVDEFFGGGYWTMKEEDQAALPGFIEWLQKTDDGDLDELEGFPRSQFSRQGDECSGRRCPFYARCFVYKARKRAAGAHLVIVNHALALAEAASPGSGILPGYGRIVMDEAHDLEAIATEYLSTEFSLPELNRIAKRILRNRKEVAPQVAVILNAAEELLAFCGKILPPKTDVRRYSAANFYFKDPQRLLELQAAFERPLIELVHTLHDFCDAIEDVDLATRLNSDASQLLGIANAAAFVLKGEAQSHAYWVERMRQDRRRAYLRLVAAPLSVADDMHRMFFAAKDSVVLCSATLKVGNDFRYSAKRLGFVPSADEDLARYATLTAESPFDYFRQVRVLAPDCLPDPSENPDDYALALAELMRELFSATDGRALVLFTSYEMMNRVAASAREQLEAAGITLHVQGEGLSREMMTRRLRDGRRVVLFGAQSFWEGVDVAGEALSCVVITRLPFAQVGDPVIEARGEAIERAGGSPFRDYALPEAVIRFRQGFGRLIRTKSDHGIVVVSDPRIVTKNYGVMFRKSIPTSVHTVTSVAELLQSARGM